MFGQNNRTEYTRYRNKEAYLFLLPWLLGLIVFTIGPMIGSFWLSFTDYSIFGKSHFIGFQNYLDIFTKDRKFWNSLFVTIKYVLILIPLKLIFALLIAFILSKNVKGISVFRIIYYIPSIIGSGVAMSITWRMVLSREGFLNSFLELFQMGPIDFLTNPDIVLITVAMVGVWEFGGAMVIFLSALKQVPMNLYEAADIDGASGISKFLRITIPMISPNIFYNLVMGLINAFQVYTLVAIMTGEGPLDSTNVYMLYLYKNAFVSHRMGYASALAWILTAIILVITVILMKTSNKWVYYDN